MATKKPVRQVATPANAANELPKKKLMDNQNRKAGDYRGSEKVKYSLLIPANILDEARDKAAEEGTTVTRLLIDGLKWRLKQED